MYLQIQENYYLSLLDKEECSKVYSQDDVLRNWENKKVLKCFCEQTFQGSIEEQLAKSKSFTFQPNGFQCGKEVPDVDPFNYYQSHSACYDYFNSIGEFNNLSDWLWLQYGITIGIATTNGLIALVSLFFAKLMKRPTISSELKESAKGTFIMQMLNMGWLALLSNIDSFKKISEYFTPQSEPLFRVMCRDFTIQFEGHSVFTLNWFFTNGTGLIVTLLLSTFTYQFSVILVFFAYRFYRWVDRGFSSNMKKTRQLIQSDYNKVYKGPIISLDNSYSTVRQLFRSFSSVKLLTFVFVVMMFAPALPITYLIAALGFTILYWLDKYLRMNKELRFYCNPPRLDERFTREVQKIIPYSILLHLGFAILIFGSIHLAPPAKGNLHIRAGDFLMVNETMTQTTKEQAIVNDLFSDIILFYQESLYQPFVSVLGFLTIVVFFLILGKMLFWDLLKAAYRNVAAYKGRYVRRTTLNLEVDFVGGLETIFIYILNSFTAVETAHLAEKIQLMEKIQVHSCFTLEFEEKFKKMLQMYKKELERRQRRQTYSRMNEYIKDMPFYSLDLSDEFRKQFGFDYSRHLEYGSK